jgi:hypothetical protein
MAYIAVRYDRSPAVETKADQRNIRLQKTHGRQVVLKVEPCTGVTCRSPRRQTDHSPASHPCSTTQQHEQAQRQLYNHLHDMLNSGLPASRRLGMLPLLLLLLLLLLLRAAAPSRKSNRLQLCPAHATSTPNALAA